MLAASCSTPTPSSLVNRAINKTVDSAAEKVGERVGEAIAADILAQNPQLIQAYAMGVFNVMFYQGGYYLETGGYTEGQYTTWQTSGLEQGEWFEKTLLREHDNGNQWWRVETHSKSDDGEESVVVMESLFSAPESSGARRVLRMRAHLPGEEEPREIPITEQNSRTWYMSDSRKLTDESMEGMTVGEEEVETPAGSFTAKHLQTKGADESDFDWWIVDSVPGSMVKFTRTQPDGEQFYTVTLQEYGEGRTESKLGVDLSQKTGGSEAGAAEESGDSETEATESTEETAE
jgi:hypothetical protein